MYSFHHLESLVRLYVTQVPLEIFSLVGSFIEEIIPPIPAPLIMTTAGSFAMSQHRTFIFLVALAIFGSVGKTFASWLFYVAGDKAEDAVLKKFGRFLGIKHEDVEGFGKRFNGGWRDGVILFILRSIPVFPSVSVSIVCGIIRLNIFTFIWMTFFGTIVKNMMYLYVGFFGIEAVKALFRNLHSVHFLLNIAFIALALSFLFWYFHGKKKGDS